MAMKDKILHYFQDINYVYNDCWKYDTLKAMLDQMELELCEDCISKLQSKTAIKRGEELDETDDRK